MYGSGIASAIYFCYVHLNVYLMCSFVWRCYVRLFSCIYKFVKLIACGVWDVYVVFYYLTKLGFCSYHKAVSPLYMWLFIAKVCDQKQVFLPISF